MATTMAALWLLRPQVKNPPTLCGVAIQRKNVVLTVIEINRDAVVWRTRLTSANPIHPFFKIVLFDYAF